MLSASAGGRRSVDLRSTAQTQAVTGVKVIKSSSFGVGYKSEGPFKTNIYIYIYISELVSLVS